MNAHTHTLYKISSKGNYRWTPATLLIGLSFSSRKGKNRGLQSEDLGSTSYSCFLFHLGQVMKVLWVLILSNIIIIIPPSQNYSFILKGNALKAQHRTCLRVSSAYCQNAWAGLFHCLFLHVPFPQLGFTYPLIKPKRSVLQTSMVLHYQFFPSIDQEKIISMVFKPR